MNLKYFKAFGPNSGRWRGVAQMHHFAEFVVQEGSFCELSFIDNGKQFIVQPSAKQDASVRVLAAYAKGATY
jgi:hypothetical protein